MACCTVDGVDSYAMAVCCRLHTCNLKSLKTKHSVSLVGETTEVEQLNLTRSSSHVTCCCVYSPSERWFCEIEVLLRTPKRPGQPLWEAPALDGALGGCEKLMKVGYLASREVSCARGRMQQLKVCNYSIMVEVDWIRATSTG